MYMDSLLKQSCFTCLGLQNVPVFAWIGEFGPCHVRNIEKSKAFDVTCQAACIWICETSNQPTIEDFTSGTCAQWGSEYWTFEYQKHLNIELLEVLISKGLVFKWSVYG